MSQQRTTNNEPTSNNPNRTAATDDDQTKTQNRHEHSNAKYGGTAACGNPEKPATEVNNTNDSTEIAIDLRDRRTTTKEATNISWAENFKSLKQFPGRNRSLSSARGACPLHLGGKPEAPTRFQRQYLDVD